jgi:hypothetical protein
MSNKWILDPYAMSQGTLEFIINYLPSNSNILELGSGEGTGILSQYFSMISIEHDENFINRHESKWIHAPIVNEWYDTEVVRSALSNLKYDLIIVDGPGGRAWQGKTKRIGFFDNLGLFNTNVPILIDDTDREDGKELVEKLSSKLSKAVQKINERSTILL